MPARAPGAQRDSGAGSAAPPAAGAGGTRGIPREGGRRAAASPRSSWPASRICLPARARTGAAPAAAGAAGTEAAAGGGPGRAAAGGAAAAASHKGQIHFPCPERGGGKAQCRVGPTATGRLWGEDLARERKASCLLDSVELYHVRKTSYYHDHLKLLESHSVFLFLIFGSLVVCCCLVFFLIEFAKTYTQCVWKTTDFTL